MEDRTGKVVSSPTKDSLNIILGVVDHTQIPSEEETLMHGNT